MGPAGNCESGQQRQSSPLSSSLSTRGAPELDMPSSGSGGVALLNGKPLFTGEKQAGSGALSFTPVRLTTAGGGGATVAANVATPTTGGGVAAQGSSSLAQGQSQVTCDPMQESASNENVGGQSLSVEETRSSPLCNNRSSSSGGTSRSAVPPPCNRSSSGGT